MKIVGILPHHKTECRLQLHRTGTQKRGTINPISVPVPWQRIVRTKKSGNVGYAGPSENGLCEKQVEALARYTMVLMTILILHLLELRGVSGRVAEQSMRYLGTKLEVTN